MTNNTVIARKFRGVLLRTLGVNLSLGVAALSLCLGFSGCRPPQGNIRVATTQTQGDKVRDDFADFLNVWSNFNDYDPSTASHSVLLTLTRWAKQQHSDPDWEPTQLVNRLPDRFDALELRRNLAKMEFTARDVDFLKETLWMKQISSWVSDPSRVRDFQYLVDRATKGMDDEARAEFERTDDRLATALTILDSSLSVEDAYQLAICLRLFDWTVRNIQLDPDPQKTDDKTAGPKPGTPKQQDVLTPGPGEQHYPWQILLYGRGDASERARVFIHLARQVGIPVIMLGYDDTGRISKATDWLPAAYIGDRLFLFDTRLGLPIPGEKTPIATLSEVKQNPELLSALNWTEGDGEELLYPVTATELTELVAMIDVAPEFLSQRMLAIQQRLTGEYKAVLTFDPDPLEQELRGKYGFSVGLWNAPYKAILYRRRLEHLVRVNPRAAAFVFQSEQIFEGYHSLVQGRLQYFEGQLQRLEDETVAGAKSHFLDARNIRDEYLKNLHQDEALQKAFGIVKQKDEGGVDFQSRVRQFQIAFLLTKVHAGYWLALSHYEGGDYGDAANWLKRAEKMENSVIWRGGMTYNLGRTHEALGQLKEAREIYFTDNSPQKHGNRLRGRLLSGDDPPQ